MTVSPAVDMSCAVTGNSGTFETPLPLQLKLALDLVQPALYFTSGFVSCQCDTVVPG